MPVATPTGRLWNAAGMFWTCVLCATANLYVQMGRVTGTCDGCGSTWRARAIALGTLAGLRLPLLPLPIQRQDWSRRGVGISDHPALAAALAGHFDYTNTYYHRFPRLDLLNVPADLRGELEFVCCSDVLEHVPPPADAALAGLHALLRTGGCAVLSVPCSNAPDTAEFYPDVTAWEKTPTGVRWTDVHGRTQVDDSPEWHGGPGQTLAFRLWSQQDFVRRLRASGFHEPLALPDSPELGVPEIPNAGVWIARKK